MIVAQPSSSKILLFTLSNKVYGEANGIKAVYILRLCCTIEIDQKQSILRTLIVQVLIIYSIICLRSLVANL